MADLSDLQAAGTVKIVGSDTSGIETTPAKVSSNQDLGVSDIIDTLGIYGSLTVGTTAVELKVGATRLSNRKLITLDNTSGSTIYWAYNSSLTTTVFAGRILRDQQASWSVGPNVSIFLIAGSPGNTVNISEGS
jgi:hypothetical protein